MKSLYESILDTDDKIQDKAEQLIAPVRILTCMRNVFGKFVRVISRVHDRSYIGTISKDEIVRGKLEDVIKEVEKRLREFNKEIKKIGGKCTYKKDIKEHSRLGVTYVSWKPLVEIDTDKYREFYGFVITIEAHNYGVDYIDVFCINDKIREASNILFESILDSDEEITNKAIDKVLPITILKYLKQYFNKFLERESNISKIGSWYTLGRVDDDLYDIDDIKKTEKIIINAIKYWHLDIKKAVPHTLISVDTRVDAFGETYVKYYTVKLMNGNRNYVIEFTLHAQKSKMGFEHVDNIIIWTKNKELSDLI